MYRFNSFQTFLLGLLCVVLAGLLTPAQAQDSTAWPGGKTFVVGFAQDHMANDWRAAQVRDVKRELDKYPFIKFIMTDSGGNTAQQISDIENMAAQGVDVLITSPRDAAAMTPLLSRIHRQGTPVVLLSRMVEGDNFTTFIGASNIDIATKAAQYLGQRLNGKGRILILQHIPSSTPGRDRTNGFMAEIKKFPGIEIAAIKRADSMRNLAIKRIEEALAENIQFDAIYAQSDSMASGARMALMQAGIDPGSIPTVGIDYITEAHDAIVAGQQDASFTYPTFGKAGAEVAVKILMGEAVPKTIMVESMAVTRDNVADVEPIF